MDKKFRSLIMIPLSSSLVAAHLRTRRAALGSAVTAALHARIDRDEKSKGGVKSAAMAEALMADVGSLCDWVERASGEDRTDDLKQRHVMARLASVRQRAEAIGRRCGILSKSF